MPNDCKGIEYSATAEVGHHGSGWWVPEDPPSWDQGYDFLWGRLSNKDAPDGIKFCGGTSPRCENELDKCLPTSFTITVTSGQAEVKEVTAEIDHKTYHSYLMVVKERATVTVKTSCACVHGPPQPWNQHPH